MMRPAPLRGSVVCAARLLRRESGPSDEEQRHAPAALEAAVARAWRGADAAADADAVDAVAAPASPASPVSPAFRALARLGLPTAELRADARAWLYTVFLVDTLLVAAAAEHGAPPAAALVSGPPRALLDALVRFFRDELWCDSTRAFEGQVFAGVLRLASDASAPPAGARQASCERARCLLDALAPVGGAGGDGVIARVYCANAWLLAAMAYDAAACACESSCSPLLCALRQLG
jgi:hypothetical protein